MQTKQSWKKDTRRIIAGIDEAGRGSWAGPVVAAAVILPRGFDVQGIRDSKRLTLKQRGELCKRICSQCPFGIGVAGSRVIDRIGIKAATHRAMLRAVRALPMRPDKLLIDGNDGFHFPLPHESFIRGDTFIASISAASIVAKAHRDHLMLRLDKHYPSYAFARNKGYGTRLHDAMLLKYGPCKAHRFSFSPIRTRSSPKPPNTPSVSGWKRGKVR